VKILSARFLSAAEEKKDYPVSQLTEIAFAGRSNVGKSSVINTLLGRRNLVKTSKTPGHTRKLNFFLINDQFIFVDLPGYGFARVPMEVKKKWKPMVETYLKERRQLAGVVLIIDARRPPTESDMNLIRFLQMFRIPLVVTATKADKLTRNRLAARAKLLRQEAGPEVNVIVFSSFDGRGKNELWKEVKKLIEGKA
jgi:GTP-binding protein